MKRHIAFPKTPSGATCLAFLKKTAPDHGKFHRPLPTEFKDTQDAQVHKQFTTEFWERVISSGQRQASMQNSGRIFLSAWDNVRTSINPGTQENSFEMPVLGCGAVFRT
ncbi:MAG: hypothetical protein ONB49_17445 [candidate division KSB1 bacterium]|nr:hypothetical protein [candidate division KSB1 bacterium]MDZ7308825.1 hypothetical protein [candidate division KSB1 bacterium]MDZ7355598.1 hypothetical protein [candidate division KSB1 bacterium]